MATGGCVYIVANENNKLLYVGVTSDIHGRIQKHKDEFYPASFTKKYNIKKLVYYKTFGLVIEAIRREKQIKKYSHLKKVLLIRSFNPEWKDLHELVRHL